MNPNTQDVSSLNNRLQQRCYNVNINLIINTLAAHRVLELSENANDSQISQRQTELAIAKTIFFFFFFLLFFLKERDKAGYREAVI